MFLCRVGITLPGRRHPMSLWQMGRALPWMSYDAFVSGGKHFARPQTSYDVFVADGKTSYDVFMADEKSFAMDVQCFYGRWEELCHGCPLMSLWQVGRALPWTSYDTIRARKELTGACYGMSHIKM